MKQRFLLLCTLLLLLSGSSLTAREPRGNKLTESQKRWIDSVNTIYGRQNPWFDSLMKADGRCEFVSGPEHFVKSDTTADVWYFHRNLYPENTIVYDGQAIVHFYYYPEEQKIITGSGPEIYLRKSGSLILEFNYGMWGAVTEPRLIRKAGDTIFVKKPGQFDDILPGLQDSTKRMLLVEYTAYSSIFSFIATAEKGRITDKSGRPARIFECRLVKTEYPASASLWTVFRRPFLVIAPEEMSSQVRIGDTLFAECGVNGQEDTLRRIRYDYFTLKRIIPVRAEKIERIFVCYDVRWARIQPISLRRERKEERSYRRFVRWNAKKNDPSGMYHDPVFRWMRRKKYWTHNFS